MSVLFARETKKFVFIGFWAICILVVSCFVVLLLFSFILFCFCSFYFILFYDYITFLFLFYLLYFVFYSCIVVLCVKKLLFVYCVLHSFCIYCIFGIDFFKCLHGLYVTTLVHLSISFVKWKGSAFVVWDKHEWNLFSSYMCVGSVVRFDLAMQMVWDRDRQCFLLFLDIL